MLNKRDLEIKLKLFSNKRRIGNITEASTRVGSAMRGSTKLLEVVPDLLKCVGQRQQFANSKNTGQS
jgi:hypothetical protein